MNAVVTNVARSGAAAANSSRVGSASDEVKSRYSEELVVALSGPVGCGLSLVRDQLAAALEAHGYTIVHVKVSDYFRELATQINVPDPTIGVSGEYQRISTLQDLGNDLRLPLGDDIGAQVALRTIAEDRIVRSGEPQAGVEEIRPGRVAYIIDQLKNPKEALLLKDVYGNLFYLVGVLSGYERRKQVLTQRMTPPEAEALIERDRAESGNGGQQLEKTLKLADFFVRNSHDNTADLRAPIDRFVGLLHGKNGITPTIHERGMYAAYSAALRSACLSRQVGAAIVDVHGNTLATGCNDVPKAGGGLYEPGIGDHRCVFREGGVCFNDRYKDQLKAEISRILQGGGIEFSVAESLAQTIRGTTRLKDLIEFSRAVHAEMDALIVAARRGGVGVQGCTLFTTTYPCHNCARHIVAAGITAVYFIEPYGKSLASELHSDSIVHDQNPSTTSVQGSGKVAFLHFEGVAPTRFATLFYALDSRKDASGNARTVSPSSAAQKAPEVLDNYRQLEAKIAQRLNDAQPETQIATPNA